MLTQVVRSISSISYSAKIAAFTTQKNALLNGVALVVTCGISAASSNPAQAMSFTGFGCSDNSSCQSYLEFGASAVAGVGNGLGGGSGDTWSLPTNRVSSPLLFDSGMPDGPRKTLNVLLNQTFTRIIGTENGTIDEPIWNVSGTASASLETVLKFGQLKALASASVDVGATELVDGFGGGGNAVAAVDSYLAWGDTITVTSNNHSPGELIPFEVSLYLDRLVSASGRYRGSSQAFVYADLYGFYIPGLSIFDSNFSPSNVTEVTTIAYLPVGELSTIQGKLAVGASARAFASLPDQPLDIDVSIADASHTANYFLTPLVDGVSYTSGSGKTYFYSGNATPVPTPALLPGLIGLGLGLWRKRKIEAES